MAEAEKERLNQLLRQHLDTNFEIFELLNQPWLSELTDVSWDDVVELGEELSTQAMLWECFGLGKGPDAQALEESMKTYSVLLHRFLLLSQGSMIDVRTTLSDEMRASAEAVANCSFKLLKESVASYGNSSKVQLSIREAVGNVWKACSSLKETPRTNITAIRQSMIRIGSYINNVFDEIEELKPDDTNDSDNSPDGDYGSDLSRREMKITELVIKVVSGTLATIRETIHSITSLFEDPETHDESAQTMDPMEGLFNACTRLQLLVDEIHSGLSPPQEISTIRAASEGIADYVGEMQEHVELINGSSAAFVDAVNDLKTSKKQLELELGCSDDADDDDDGDDDDDDDDENDDGDDDDVDVDDELVSEMKNLELDSSCH